MMMTLVPAGLLVAAMMLVMRYPIDARLHQRITRVIDRRSLTAVDNGKAPV